MCLHRLAKDRQQARQFGTFLANPWVSTAEMVIYAGQQTGRRVAGRHILTIQDTTELHFATHTASKKGFGTAGNGVDPGLFLHPSLAVDADTGGIIGLVDCAIINRTEGKVTDRHKRAAEEKESRRWLDGALTAGDVLSEAAMITMVADRESDIYDLFARRPANVHLLCRSMHNRMLTDGTPLAECCARWQERSRYKVDVPVRGTRPARQATVRLRFGTVSLRRPDSGRRGQGGGTEPVGCRCEGGGHACRPGTGALAPADHASGDDRRTGPRDCRLVHAGAGPSSGCSVR